jgi:hypothetical protein
VSPAKGKSVYDKDPGASAPGFSVSKKVFRQSKKPPGQLGETHNEVIINAKSPDEYRENLKLIGAFFYIRTFVFCHRIFYNDR